MNTSNFSTASAMPPDEPSPYETLLSAVECAHLAPSGHNRQPWRFRLGPDFVDLTADRSRGLPVLDPEGRELTISCGVALFYLRLALRCLGRGDMVTLMPDPLQPDWIARVQVGEAINRSAEDVELFQAIPRRHTNRLSFSRSTVPESLCVRLMKVAQQEKACLWVIDGESERAAVVHLIGEGVHVLSEDATFRQEMGEWFHPLREEDTDGISHLSSEIGKLLTHSGPLTSAIDGGDLLARQEKNFASDAPLLAALGTVGDTPADWLIAGQALAHVLLLAAAHNINAAYLNQPIQVRHLRPLLRGVIGMEAQPQLLLAMGRAPAVSPSPRRPMTEICEKVSDVEKTATAT